MFIKWTGPNEAGEACAYYVNLAHIVTMNDSSELVFNFVPRGDDRSIIFDLKPRRTRKQFWAAIDRAIVNGIEDISDIAQVRSS